MYSVSCVYYFVLEFYLSNYVIKSQIIINVILIKDIRYDIL